MINFFKKLLGKHEPEPRTPVEDRAPDFKFTYVDLGTFTIDPTKKYHRSELADELVNNISSPNQRYLLEWENGRFRFSDRKKIIKKGKMIAPNDGKVANN